MEQEKEGNKDGEKALEEELHAALDALGVFLSYLEPIVVEANRTEKKHGKHGYPDKGIFGARPECDGEEGGTENE